MREALVISGAAGMLAFVVLVCFGASLFGS
jgi:hypothetical protein